MSATSAPAQTDAAPEPISLKTRKTHTKSRGGCVECKRRKQKCREQKPVCSGCTKRETACIYLEVESHQARTTERNRFESDASSSISSPSSTSILQPMVSVNSQFSLQDMELWHHYIVYTSEQTSVMFGRKPEIGLSCDYLLHGMLATAAIHQAYRHPDQRQKYNLLARQHLDQSFGPYHRALAIISDENVENLFSYNVLLVICSLASAESVHTSASGKSSGGIADWVVCIRGCRSIAAASTSNVQGIPIRQWIDTMIQVPMTAENSAKISPEEEGSFSRVESLLEQSKRSNNSQNMNDITACLQALQELRKTFAFTTDGFDAMLTTAMKSYSTAPVSPRLSRRLFVTIWPFLVSDRFVELLLGMYPPALMIMAHYCLILRRTQDCWYMAESGLRIFQAIQNNLAEEWSAYIEYPRRVFSV
ncbi:hypothetical protein WAI453_008975 [Rhynchosporium graminicola]|uniref:Zn(2)-C6 fungal-type domain-containing protein n=1 Tax=Rhynchosporium graminicola TaxID=2792576 RepID=A0A1E1L236_9HELO|nr:uncharacterized protein RCO7_07636 [Rhynchosporium commune]